MRVQTVPRPALSGVRLKQAAPTKPGKSYGEVAQAAGRRSNDAVAHMVSRSNQDGLAALASRHGGGAQTVYKLATVTSY